MLLKGCLHFVFLVAILKKLEFLSCCYYNNLGTSHHLIDEWYKFCSTIGPANPHDFSVSETFLSVLFHSLVVTPKEHSFLIINTSTFVKKYGKFLQGHRHLMALPKLQNLSSKVVGTVSLFMMGPDPVFL